jgi:hypothetical protein
VASASNCAAAGTVPVFRKSEKLASLRTAPRFIDFKLNLVKCFYLLTAVLRKAVGATCRKRHQTVTARYDYRTKLYSDISRHNLSAFSVIYDQISPDFKNILSKTFATTQGSGDPVLHLN